MWLDIFSLLAVPILRPTLSLFLVAIKTAKYIFKVRDYDLTNHDHGLLPKRYHEISHFGPLRAEVPKPLF